MNDLNDLPNYIPGIPPLYGLKQPSPEYTQGNDLVLEFDLEFEGKPLSDVTNWWLTGYVKKSLKAVNILWQAEYGTYLYKKEGTTNRYCLRIPRVVTALFLPGSYYFAIRGTQKPATGIPRDLQITLHKGMFQIDLDASSPNPKLANFIITSVSVDWLKEEGFVTITTQSTEPTEPENVL